MMFDFSYTILILIIPLVMFLFLGLFGMKFKPSVSGILGTLGLGIITCLSYYTAYRYFFDVGKVGEEFVKLIPINFRWLNLTESLHIDMGILLDPISVMMLVVITTVSFMVNLYSIGYMHGEKGYERFFATLSLFTFSMLGLVIATNIFQMYIFWELVGVSSFLLIGFYYERPSAIAASKKAFIVTRFADLGFLIGILLLSYYTKTFDFVKLTGPEGIEIMKNVSGTFMGVSVGTWALMLVFMGGAGKSAMFPLHIWLPDAMEGPTPVSALIHAATMVVAGVFLVARMFPLYIFTAPHALTIIAYVGGFTSLFAAVIACTQYDIKRVLAFSTLSQIGYMMLALGVSGYGGEAGLGFMASMFHLFTHAMFKALLFLGAGAIIHAVHSNLMTDMGGLAKKIKWTHATFLIACVTIAGVWPFSAFWSKDEILVAAYHHDKILFVVEYLVAGLTAFYMFRLYFRVFWHSDPHYHHAPHEAPKTMLIPLIVLAFGTIFAGFLPFSQLVTSDSKPFESATDLTIAIPSVLIGLIGIFIAYIFYYKENNLADKFSNALGGLYRTIYNKFYIDEIYLFVTKKILFNLVSRPVAWFDRHVVDGTMNGVAWVIRSTSSRIKGVQSGQLQTYGFVFITGSIALALLLLYLWV
jgi:NADH-quinone oxidoreductase subunit L